MNAEFAMFFRRMLCFFIILSAAGCTTTVRGRVIDAETGEPVEGAVYAIHWYYLRGCCLGIRFGDGSGKEVLEVADGFTDADGYFEVPKYGHTLIMPPIFRMGVYKKAMSYGMMRKLSNGIKLMNVMRVKQNGKMFIFRENGISETAWLSD